MFMNKVQLFISLLVKQTSLFILKYLHGNLIASRADFATFGLQFGRKDHFSYS